jgi:MGT family glycosyltransferase
MDPNIPPHLSGCNETDHEGHKAFREHFNEVIGPIHADFNNFLDDCGIAPYATGQFCESSPYLNLLLYPEPVKFNRANPLDPNQFQYLEGCVRKEEDYSIPDMGDFNDKPIIYISFGTLGSGEPDLLKRMIAVVGNMDVRALVNVGDYMDEYDKQTLPANVHIQNWFPQPSVIPQVDIVIHHGGNNSFTECLYFGKPAIIMPYVWDGHDNATRVEETGHGLKMHRSNWQPEELAAKIEACLHDSAMAAKLKATSEHMQSANGQQKAAALLDQLLQENAV